MVAPLGPVWSLWHFTHTRLAQKVSEELKINYSQESKPTSIKIRKKCSRVREDSSARTVCAKATFSPYSKRVNFKY